MPFSLRKITTPGPVTDKSKPRLTIKRVPPKKKVLGLHYGPEAVLRAALAGQLSRRILRAKRREYRVLPASKGWHVAVPT